MHGWSHSYLTCPFIAARTVHTLQSRVFSPLPRGREMPSDSAFPGAADIYTQQRRIHTHTYTCVYGFCSAHRALSLPLQRTRYSAADVVKQPRRGINVESEPMARERAYRYKFGHARTPDAPPRARGRMRAAKIQGRIPTYMHALFLPYSRDREREAFFLPFRRAIIKGE